MNAGRKSRHAFLGFRIDARSMTVTWPFQKRTELRDEILATLKNRGQASPIANASILGKLRCLKNGGATDAEIVFRLRWHVVSVPTYLRECFDGVDTIMARAIAGAIRSCSQHRSRENGLQKSTSLTSHVVTIDQRHLEFMQSTVSSSCYLQARCS